MSVCSLNDAILANSLYDNFYNDVLFLLMSLVLSASGEKKNSIENTDLLIRITGNVCF